jgi:hypothetical protein
MKKLFFTTTVLFIVIFISAQDIYPTHWWAGMKHKNLQLLLHEKNIANNFDHASTVYPGVTILSTEKFTNKNYLAINLLLDDDIKPGIVNINLKDKQNKNRVIPYVLKKKSDQNGITRVQGITSADFIYLIMPDRFSNGDPSNDKVRGMRDQSLNRDTIFERHGGDLKGVQNHLDYLEDLGVTAVWLNPVIENDMPNRTEHGYAFTDHYKIDRRIGGENLIMI